MLIIIEREIILLYPRIINNEINNINMIKPIITMPKNIKIIGLEKIKVIHLNDST